MQLKDFSKEELIKAITQNRFLVNRKIMHDMLMCRMDICEEKRMQATAKAIKELEQYVNLNKKPNKMGSNEKQIKKHLDAYQKYDNEAKKYERCFNSALQALKSRLDNDEVISDENLPKNENT